jgi:hypothetical protein
MEADAATSRYRSRILRELNANRENPFNSPPSSTGSHGTLTLTMSSVLSDPEGESTRKLNEDIARVTGSRAGKIQVDWEAAHRKWPEFYGKPKRAQATVSSTFDFDAKLTAATTGGEFKENIPPKFEPKIMDDSTQDTWAGSKRTRAEMQPRVENESDLSSVMSTRSPLRLQAQRSRYSRETRHRSPLARALSRSPVAAPAHQTPRASAGDALKNLKKSLAIPDNADPVPASSPGYRAMRKAGPVTFNTIRDTFPSPIAMDSPAKNGATSRSFFMPDIAHLGDFVSGTLRFSGSMRNGVPVFVKGGRARDLATKLPPNDHAEVDAIEIPQDEEKIFVSMDMIRDEICTLQEHDDMVQKYAEELQVEVERLQSEVTKLRSRKSIDSALGSRTGSEPDTAGYEQLIAEKLRKYY